MQARRRGPIRSWAGRFPTALAAGVLILFATPLFGAGPASQRILGITDTAGSVSSSAALGAPRAPDPGGQGSIPDVRLAPPTSSLTGYVWPIRKARLTLPFGPTPWGSRIVDGELFHDGLDLATFCGDRIHAAHAGTVLAAGRHYDDVMGWVGDLTAYTNRLDEKHLWLTLPNVVVIDDGNGYRSVYAHFSGVAVKPGDVVKAGDFLGWEGMTGHATGCHLHYGVFSPYTADTFGYDPVAAAHMLLPTKELARIDPRLVLPSPASAGIR